MCACASHAHEKQQKKGGREVKRETEEEERERGRERGGGSSSCESEVKSSTTTLITPRAEIIKTILTMMPVLEMYELHMKLVKQGQGERGCMQARISP